MRKRVISDLVSIGNDPLDQLRILFAVLTDDKEGRLYAFAFQDV